MKKLYLLFFVSFLSVAVLASNPYKLDSDVISSAFDNATEVSLQDFNYNTVTLLEDGDEPTMKGFIVRAIFCGGCAMHRSYMGTEGMFTKYCWNPIGCIDGLSVLIKKEEAYNKYKDNDEWIVFKKDK